MYNKDNKLSRWSNYMKHDTINSFRYLIIVGTVLGTLLIMPKEQYPLFVLLVLLFIINIQLRNILTNNRLSILSILFDNIIILYLYSSISIYLSLLLLVTLSDCIFKLKFNFHHLLFITSGMYIYSFNYSPSLEIGILMILIYFIVLFLLLTLRKEHHSKINVETLYDEIRVSHYELERTRSRLKEYSKQVEQVTKLEERNRISRELHDTLGHHLTGTLLQIDLAMQMIIVDQDKGMEILQSVYKNVNSSIENVREIVKNVRPIEYQTYQSSVKVLIEEFKENTAIEVEYKNSGIPYELYPSIETVIYRNIQEALTNAVRHGQSTHILVHMIYKQQTIEVMIHDNGIGCETIKKGYGLKGMEERIEMIAGRITFQLDNGFLIHMIIPRKEIS